MRPERPAPDRRRRRGHWVRSGAMGAAGAKGAANAPCCSACQRGATGCNGCVRFGTCVVRCIRGAVVTQADRVRPALHVDRQFRQRDRGFVIDGHDRPGDARKHDVGDLRESQPLQVHRARHERERGRDRTGERYVPSSLAFQLQETIDAPQQIVPRAEERGR